MTGIEYNFLVSQVISAKRELNLLSPEQMTEAVNRSQSKNLLKNRFNLRI